MSDDNNSKSNRLNRIAQGLGAVRQGAVLAAKGGYFGAKSLAAETGQVIKRYAVPVSIEAVRAAIVAELDEQEGTPFEAHKIFADKVVERLSKR